MSSAEVDPEVRRKRIARNTKILITLVVGLIVSPVIFLAVKGVVGLAVAWLLAEASRHTAEGLGTVAVQFAPVVSMKVANWKLKMIKAEAERNPIETMQIILVEKSEAIQQGDEKIVQFAARLAEYNDKLEGFKERFPQKAARFEEIAVTMRKGLDRMKRKQAVAKEKQALYKAKIEEAEAIYEMAKSARAVSELSADVEKAVFQEIRQQVSFDAVNREFNMAVAELSVEVDNDKEFTLDPVTGEAPKMLAAKPITSDDSTSTIREKEEVLR